jgi:putative peptidoglycan lipid II flippase
VIGLVREQIIGRTLGASRQADLYFASFTLPDFLNYLLAAGALSIVFIPIFLEHLSKDDSKRAWQALSATANFIGVACGVGIAILMIFARPLAEIVVPGFTGPGELDTLTRLIRIILPAQFFLVIGGLLSAALQAQDRHFLPALAPLVYSSGIIAGGLIGERLGLGAEGFAWGVLLGAAIGPFALPLCGCIRTNMRWYPIFSLSSSDLRRYLRLSLPIMIGFSIVVVDEWIIKNQASYLPEGSLAYLQYARTLMKVPIGVFGMAAGVASYPTISRMVAAGSVVEAYAVLAHAVRLMLVVTFAAQIVFTLCGFELTYLIWGFLSHRFTVADAQSTATVLVFLCLGLGGWAAQTVVSRGFYALGNTWLPTLVGTAVAFGAVPIYILLRHEWGAIGLAVASGIAILIYVFLLAWLQYRRFAREAASRGTTLDRVTGMLDATVRLSFAAAIAIGLGLGIRGVVLAYLPGIDLAPLLARTALLSLVGVGTYAALAAVFGIRELSEIKTFLAHELRVHAFKH